MRTMALGQNEHLQQMSDDYFDETGKDTATTRELAIWAIETGRWNPPPDLAVQMCRQQFAKALREHFIHDELGRSVRAKHVVRELKGEKQLYLWADIRNASPAHMEKAFTQRREQIVGECRQLQRDVDFFNCTQQRGREYQLFLDFRDDVEEGEFSTKYPPKRPR